jgi:hypothetical protein
VTQQLGSPSEAGNGSESAPISAEVRKVQALTARSPIPPCRYLGRELTGLEREAGRLGHVRRWSLCLHPEQPLGASVCRCRGCGPKCPGYAPLGASSAETLPESLASDEAAAEASPE